MKHNRFSYYIKEGISSIFRHGFMSFASVCIIIACLMIMGSFSLLALNVNAIIGDLEDQNQILAFVDENLSEDESRGLEATLKEIPNVASVTFVSKEEAMESFKEQYADASLLDDLDSSVLRDRYIIYLDDISLMEQTQSDLLNVDGIVKVNAHLEIAQGFVSLRNVVSVVSLILVAILFVVSLFIMSNTIKLTTFERREEIAIMKMVGATSSFIRWPFVVEGLLLGMFGSLTAYVLQWGIYQTVADRLMQKVTLSFVEVLPFSSMAIPLLLAFAVLGFGVGVVGSLVAIKNYLKV